ncbi:MAG: selenocysteine-specific translation elongation factor, partial [Pseudomonadales bacterium]|nr:selenocysteine-specific translation elongation factor [Pseudomonadales bacterium]
MTSSAPCSELHAANRFLTIATAGHVDHGKSSLVKWLTDTDTDTLSEEKARGLSINLGFAYAHHPEQNCSLGFVDVPGHRDFIHNMLAGVSAIDAALLVVAADDGIMPQTREHLAILNLLGLRHGVIAITKTDKVDDKRLQSLQVELQALLADTSLARAPLLGCSCLSGDGLESVHQALLKLAADIDREQQLIDDRLFRFQVDRSFSLKGIGTVVTGTALSGFCTSGASLLHSASGETLRVRGLRFDATDLETVTAGQRAAINLANINAADISRGDYLQDSVLQHPVQRIDVRMNWLASKTPNPGSQFHLHLGAAHHLVAIRPLAADNCFQIRSHTALHCNFGDRFIIRDPTGKETVGGGRVIDSFVPRKQRNSPQRLEQLRAMDQPDRAALVALTRLRPEGVKLGEFRINRNLAGQALDRCIEEMRQAGMESFRLSDNQGNDYLIARNHFESLTRGLIKLLTDYHARHPSDSGVSESFLNQGCKFPGSFALFKAILAKLLKLGLLGKTANSLHLPNHQAQQSVEEKLFDSEIRPHLLKADKIPPRTRELVELTGIKLPRLESILKHCARRGQLIAVADNRYFLPATIEQLAEFTEQLAAKNDGEFTVIE